MQQQKLIFGARARRNRRRTRLRAHLGLAVWIASLITAGGGAVTQVETLPGSAPGKAVLLQSAFMAPVLSPEPGDDATQSGARRPSSKSRPRPAEPSDPVEGAISSAASEFGVDANYLRSLASCESDLDPNAHSPAGYYGLFQFDEETWSEYGYGSIWDPAAQARTAAGLLAMGEHDRWPNCP